MSRIRTIKPEFFTSEDIVSLTPLTRLFYVSLWCEADREGRFEWKPKTLKMRYLPADNCDIEALGKELIEGGQIVIYEGDDGRTYAFIPGFKKHQVINNREAESSIPAPKNPRVKDACLTRSRGRKEGREGKEGTPPNPQGDRFDEFWKAWPQSERKQDKGKCRDKWDREDFGAIADRILSDIATKRRTQKWAEGYIEAPIVYLNNKRWEDGVVPLADSQDCPDLDPLAWARSRSGVITRACELGIGPWDESNAAAGTGPSWPQYRSEVMAADAAQRQGVAA